MTQGACRLAGRQGCPNKLGQALWQLRRQICCSLASLDRDLHGHPATQRACHIPGSPDPQTRGPEPPCPMHEESFRGCGESLPKFCTILEAESKKPVHRNGIQNRIKFAKQRVPTLGRLANGLCKSSYIHKCKSLPKVSWEPRVILMCRCLHNHAVVAAASAG